MLMYLLHETTGVLFESEEGHSRGGGGQGCSESRKNWCRAGRPLRSRGLEKTRGSSVEQKEGMGNTCGFVWGRWELGGEGQAVGRLRRERAEDRKDIMWGWAEERTKLRVAGGWVCRDQPQE